MNYILLVAFIFVANFPLFWSKGFKQLLVHDLHPMSMTQMEKIFSELVLGDTFPNPTLVRLLKVKYSAVTYLSLMEGPEPGVERLQIIWSSTVSRKLT